MKASERSCVLFDEVAETQVDELEDDKQLQRAYSSVIRYVQS